MRAERTTTRTTGDGFVFSSDIRAWMPSVREKRQKMREEKSKSLRKVRTKNDHVRSMNNLLGSV